MKIMADLDSTAKHENLLKTWRENFRNLMRSLQLEGLNPMLVAMSRKMPRLIELIRREFSDSELDNYHFVSEHVLPYVLRGFDVNRQCVVIVDDAIYYGSTIKHIIGYIQAICHNAKVFVCPIAISEVVGNFPTAEVVRNDENTILEKNIPFFTTHNAMRIISLSRPIDVEFPILHFKIKNVVASWRDNVEEVLKKHFSDCTVYGIKHYVGVNEEGNRQYSYNYNVLPRKKTSYDCWNKDFSKLRFFVSDTSLQVVAYAPGILSEKSINDSTPLFSDAEILSLWHEVQECKTAMWPDDLEGVQYIDLTRDAYYRQQVRSKIMWANYLASYLYLLVRKVDIHNVVSELFGLDALQTAAFSEEDTMLLLPPDKVNLITSALSHRFLSECEENSVFRGMYSSVLANQELIPVEYENEYNESIQRGIQRCGTAESALSLLFSSQHFFISGGGMAANALQSTQRLRFGITYTALENKLAFPVGINGLWEAIHKWIDKNIDEGTIKPKYERVEVDGEAYWLRMFRSGENEDSFTKLRRLCEFIIACLRNTEYRSYVKRDHVENLLALSLIDPCGIIEHDYQWQDFECERVENEPVWIVGYKLQTGGLKRFVDYLLDQGYLSSLNEQSGAARLATITESRVATSLTAMQEKAVSDYVEAYWYYTETRHQFHIMNNFFPINDEQAYLKEHNKLKLWCERFEKLITPGESSNDDFKVSQFEFDQLDEEFNHIINVTMKVLDYVAGKPDNKNREKIENHIWKEDAAEYVKFKKELLSVAVVKELYEQLFMQPEKKDTADVLEGYLDLIEVKPKIEDTIRKFVRMSQFEKESEENRIRFIVALQDIIKDNI